MTYRVIQWATGLVGQEAIKGVLAHPELELVGCWVHSDDKVGRDVGEICGIGPIGVTATNDARRDLRDRRRRGRLLAGAGEHARRDPRCSSRARTSSRRSAGSIPADDARASPRSRPRAIAGSVDAARHRHQPGRHHRAVPADALGAVPRHPPRARRGVLRHPQLPDRRSVVREVMLFGKAPGDGARRARCSTCSAHGFMQSIDMVAAELGLDARRREAHDARDGGRDQADSTRRSA